MVQDAQSSTLAHIAEPLRHLAVPIDSLTLDPANARKHNDRNLDTIKGSLKRWGQRFPIVVQRQGNVVRAGNGRVMAAKALGWTHIAALVVDESDVEAVAFALADNRSSELAEWDNEALAKLVESLPSEMTEVTGFTDDEIQSIIDELQPPTLTDDEAPEPLPEPVARKGELWLLGEHRLLCGDSTKPEDVERVMAGEKAALFATDPPYLIDYTGSRMLDGVEKGKDWSGSYHEVQIEDADHFYRSVFANALKVIAPKAAIYCWHAHPRYLTLAKVWEELGLLNHQMIIWVKPAALFGHTFYMFRHEPCLFGWVKGSMPEHDADHTHNSVWEIDWEGRAKFSGDHPTTKPLEIFARPMRKHTRPGQVCYEPFSGSGSQIVAAEQLRRRCFAIEIEPRFVDVAVRRWQTVSGKQATLEGDGRTWEEVRAKREASTQKTPACAGVEEGA